MERVREWDVEALAKSSRRNQRRKANWATARKSGTLYGAVELAVEGEGALRVTNSGIVRARVGSRVER